MVSDIIYSVYQSGILSFENYFIQHNARESIKEDKLSSYIQQQVEKQNIPGLAAAYIHGDNEEIICRGYSDLKNNNKVKVSTRFEIGSNSKSFTSYAIYKLVNERKITLEDNISKYLKDFHLYYSGIYRGIKYRNKEVKITIQQLLNHTSGISEDTIALIPEDDSKDSLKTAVYMINNQKLTSYPGERFEYATINYDILGYIIEQVTGMPFEVYMKQQVFDANHLYDTSAELYSDKAKGYKYDFWGVREYKAPSYKGNVPAGYISSNIKDMQTWLKLQMGKGVAADGKAMQQTQVPNYANAAEEIGTYYAAGWIYQKVNEEELLFHSGLNPNYSSYMIINTKKQIGVCILSNIGTSSIQQIGFNIYQVLRSETSGEVNYNIQKKCNIIARFGIIFLTLFSTFIVFCIIRKIIISKGNIEIIWNQNTIWICVLMVLIFILIKFIPKVFYFYADWKFIKVWMPNTLNQAFYLVRISLVLFFLNYVISDKINRKESIIFNLIVISILSGIGNAAVILIINNALHVNLQIRRILFFQFICSLALYIVGQKVVRYDLINITNNIVYKQRIELVKLILNSDYQKFTQANDGNVENCLVNDTAIISNFNNIIVGILTNSTTILFCLAYIGSSNKKGLLLISVTVLLAGGMYAYFSKKANTYWNHARTIQNTFYQRIHDLLSGFSELYINNKKRRDYLKDIENTCQLYRDEISAGSIRFAEVFIIGELMFTIAIAVAAFVIPILLYGNNYNVSSCIFMLLYISGPINGIINAIPNLIQVKISWNRIKQFRYTLNNYRSITRENKLSDADIQVFEKIEVCNVVFRYSGDNNFQIGPLSVSFHKNEISFIIGGNGSGKSSFMKVLTGLCEYQKGSILVNDTIVSSADLGEMFSAVLSENYLFETLYGVDTKNRMEEIENLLEKLNLEEDVSVIENKFNTLDLSSGQKQRLALMIAYLDDKPIFLFDEWAANQEPNFKKIFYYEILPELKNQGKCVIVVTHDDAYYDIADKIYRMKDGKILTVENN